MGGKEWVKGAVDAAVESINNPGNIAALLRTGGLLTLVGGETPHKSLPSIRILATQHIARECNNGIIFIITILASIKLVTG